MLLEVRRKNPITESTGLNLYFGARTKCRGWREGRVRRCANEIRTHDIPIMNDGPSDG